MVGFEIVTYNFIIKYFSLFPLVLNTLILLSFLLFLSAVSLYYFECRRAIINIFKILLLTTFLVICILLLLKVCLYVSLRGVSQQFIWEGFSKLMSIKQETSLSSFLPLFSDTILVLCVFLSILSWVLLSERSLFTNFLSIGYFLSFIFFTTNMVYSVNLIHMFLFFEFLFFPSLYFVYTTGYSKKVDKTIFYLLSWTYAGSILVLVSTLYVYSVHKTGNISLLLEAKYSNTEATCLFWGFFIGFGVKVPIWPFHYWLTKVHVEAPAGFSIFLSGFLVKTALYCLYFSITLFSTPELRALASILALCGFIDASLRMWGVQDLKKLVAFATIQEMNLILLFLLIAGNHMYSVLNLFLLIHGFLSALFFFLVDLIQKVSKTRDLSLLSGFSANTVLLQVLIWCGLLIFRGFPIFVKFFIEWELTCIIIEMYSLSIALIFLTSVWIGFIGFSRAWFIVLYGQPSRHTSKTWDISLRNFVIANILICTMLFLNFITFLFFDSFTVSIKTKKR